jgi:myo-inositol 2-dehydrogenase / D-chiro-inositol 1-dehydrogenase
MIRVAVLGAGRIGQIHAANVAANPLAQLVAVADPIAAAGNALAAKLNCEATTDAEALIQRADIDAVVIGTPSDTHAKLMLIAAKAGKSVLCEKPVDNDLNKADQAVAELKQLNAKVMMAFNRRFDPSNIELKRAIEAGDIGEVRQVLISSRDPGLPPRDYIATSGGIFRDMAIHDFDMARFLLGEEPVEVYAKATRSVNPGLMAEFDDYDALMVIMQTASGKQCHINCCREASYGYDQRFEILGSKGMLLNDNLRPSTVRRYTATETEAQQPLLNFFLQRYTDAYRNELDAFLKALTNNTPMPTSPWDGRQALRLAEAAIESVQTGKTVAV